MFLQYAQGRHLGGDDLIVSSLFYFSSRHRAVAGSRLGDRDDEVVEQGEV